MPRFFFDVDGGGRDPVPDSVGETLDAVPEARARVMARLPDLSREHPLEDGEFRTWTLTVRDEAGHVACRYILTLLADPVQPDADRVLRPA